MFLKGILKYCNLNFLLGFLLSHKDKLNEMTVKVVSTFNLLQKVLNCNNLNGLNEIRLKSDLVYGRNTKIKT